MRKRELLAKEENEMAAFQQEVAVAKQNKELLLQQQYEEIGILRRDGEKQEQTLKAKLRTNHTLAGV